MMRSVIVHAAPLPPPSRLPTGFSINGRPTRWLEVVASTGRSRQGSGKMHLHPVRREADSVARALRITPGAAVYSAPVRRGVAGHPAPAASRSRPRDATAGGWRQRRFSLTSGAFSTRPPGPERARIRRPSCGSRRWAKKLEPGACPPHPASTTPSERRADKAAGED